jgi:hypothetical protein
VNWDMHDGLQLGVVGLNLGEELVVVLTEPFHLKTRRVTGREFVTPTRTLITPHVGQV